MPNSEQSSLALAQQLGLDAASSWLEQALTHPSFANERQDAGDNQRLEFLGDAVLGLCASELLFERFPDAPEGSLTRLRAKLVNAESLQRIGRELEVSSALRLGKGADSAGLRDSLNVVADAVEALIAAAFLEGGWSLAREVCRRLLAPHVAGLEADAGRDAKSELQERLQVGGGAVPSYAVVEEGGPAHERWFEVEVSVEGLALGRGRGRSKRLAERAAAQVALEAEVWNREETEAGVENA
ncbi:MAG: ribonuclease III [Myxococcales bacterium]|nr:ribonuclease III [Myxococcales bacterium]